MNEEIGYLVVSVTGARGNFPLKGAVVRIYADNGENDLELISVLETDSSGRTAVVPLPAPMRSASMTPDSGVQPYSLYTVDTDYDGYYSVQNINVPIYPGITAIQSVAMIPKSYGVTPNEDTRFNESDAPDL